MRLDKEKIAFTLGGARFEGTLSADGSEIAGHWSEGGVKIPLRLKVVPQIALAFHQQVAVDGMLLEDGNESFELPTGYLRPHCGDGNLGSRANVEGRLDRAGIFVELHFFQRYPGH